MTTTDTQVLYRPESADLSFLPEGPYSLGDGRISWVAIQHGAGSVVGSINILDLNSGQNKSHQLPGRPGFAFPTDQTGVFVAGVERQLGLFNTTSDEWHVFQDRIEDDVTETIINDGITFDGNLLFGCKDPKFEDAKAGLYLWRAQDQTLHKLRSDQTCSNGKAVRLGDGLRIIDIDTPTKQVVEFDLDLETGSASDRKLVLDLTELDMFPDGMLLTPNGRSVIIAFYNPNDADYGEARQYGLESGEVETIWRCEKSPQVTCPQLVRVGNDIKLVLTTAVENMPPDRQAVHSNAGCLFIGDTDFSSIGDQPVFDVPTW